MPETSEPANAAGGGGLFLGVRASRRERAPRSPKPRENQGKYPEVPGFKGDLNTGREAAANFAPRATPIRIRALAVIERRSSTAEEVAAEIGEHFMIVRARCSELRAKGLIEDSGERGDGALGGRVVRWRRTTPEERAIHAARKAAESEKDGGDHA